MDLSSDKLTINNRKAEMQTNKQIADEMFESANAIHKVSRTGQLYGQLLAIKDMQIHLLEQEKMLKEEIEREEKIHE